MKKNLVFVLIITSVILFISNNFAQKEKAKYFVESLKTPSQLIDSLKFRLIKAMDDTNKVNILNGLAKQYLVTTPDSGFVYANQAIEQAQLLNWDKGIADGYYNIGNIQLANYLFDSAYQNFEKSLRISKIINYYELSGNNLIGIANCFAGKKNYYEGKRYLSEALRTFKDIGNSSGEGKTYLNYGNLFLKEGKNDSALGYYEKALKIFEDNEDKTNISKSLGNIGNVHFALMNFPIALEYYEKALKIDIEIENKIGVSRNSRYMGNAYNSMSNYPKALVCYEKALKINEELRDITGVSANLTFSGEVYNNLLEFPRALECYDKALKIQKNLKNNRGISSLLGNIGAVYKRMTDYPKALDYYEQSLEMNEEFGDSTLIMISWDNIGEIYNGLHDYNKALDCFEKALKISEEIRDRRYIGINNAWIGMVYYWLADYSKAMEYYKKALKLAEEFGDKYSVGTCLNQIGSCYLKIPDDTTKKYSDSTRKAYLEKGVEYQKKAVQTIKELGLKSTEKELLLDLSDAYIANGDYKNALKTYKEANIMKDSIFSAETFKKIAEIEAKTELVTKEKENIRLLADSAQRASDLLLSENKVELLQSQHKTQSLELDRNRLEIERKNDKIVLLSKDTALLAKDKAILSKNNDILSKDKAINEIDRKYQVKVRDSLNAWITLSIVGIVLLMVLGIVLFLFFWRKKKHNEELSEKNKIIEDANLELSTLNDNLTQVNYDISVQKEELEKANQLISSDLENAAEYVFSLLPAKLNGEITTDWIYIPSASLGGDAFSYHWIDNENFAFYLLDVSGHGIGACLHSVSILNMLKSSSLIDVDTRKPELVMDYLNKSFQMTDYNGMYFTMWYGVYNHKTRKLNFSNAGHPAPVLVDNNGKTEYLDTENLFIGTYFVKPFESREIEIKHGTKIYIFSDGVYEVKKSDNNMMNLEEFYDLVKYQSSAGKSKTNELTTIHDKVLGISKNELFEDDFSIMKVELN